MNDYTKDDNLNPVQCIYYVPFASNTPEVIFKYSTIEAIHNFVIPLDSKKCAPYRGAELKKEDLIQLRNWINKAIEYYE